MSKRRVNDSDKSNPSLHEEGYQIHRQQFEITPFLFREIRRQSYHAGAIFNHGDGTLSPNGNRSTIRNDNKRRQANLRPTKILEFVNLLKQFLHEIAPKHTANNWVVLSSLPGCQDQAAHCDYVPSATSDEQMPLAVLVALQPNTRLHVWPRSIRITSMCLNGTIRSTPAISRTTINLNPGDVCIFRGDLVHAGSAYDNENIRLHCYLDSDAVPRCGNRTYLIHRHAPQEVRTLINVD